MTFERIGGSLEHLPKELVANVRVYSYLLVVIVTVVVVSTPRRGESAFSRSAVYLVANV